MKQVSAFALGLVVLVSCGRASNLEPSDDLGSGGADSSSQTGGSTASGGNSSGGATGSSAAGGEAALGGIGGEDGLPLCEPWGYPVPTVTQRLIFADDSVLTYWQGVDGEHSYESPVVTGRVNESQVKFEWPEPPVSFRIESEPPLLRQLFTEGEELHMKFHLTDYFPLFAELRRTDGSLLAFIHTGIFQPELIASLDLPLSFSLESACQVESADISFFERMSLHTQVGNTDVELSSYEERQIEIEGKAFMLTVYYAANFGNCLNVDCPVINRPGGGPNLDMQLIALE